MEDAAGALFLTGFASIWILIVCFSVIVGLIFTIATIWLFIAEIVDLMNKNEAEFKDKTVWIVVLAISFVFGFSLIPSVIYYLLYKPNLRFWQK